jgi:hypothetical protein
LCQDVIDQIDSRTPPSGNPFEYKPTICVESLLQRLLENCAADMISVFDDANINPKCHVPNIVMGDCTTAGWGGWYHSERHEIVLCMPPDGNMDRLCTTLRHELAHAQQNCKNWPNSVAPGGGTYSRCEQSIYKELHAYSVAKQCTDFQSCIKRVIGSSCGAKHCQPSDFTDKNIQNWENGFNGWFNKS